MNKLLLVALAAGVLLAVYFAVLPDAAQEMSADGVGASGKIARKPATTTLDVNAEEKKVAVQNNESERYQAVSDNPQFPSLEQRIAELNQLYPYREFSSAEVLDLLAQANAWESSPDIPESLPITDEQRDDGRAFIELNPERFQVLLPGDTLELPLEKLGMHLQMQVDSREPLANGGFTLHGHLVGSAELMRVTITQGPGLSLAGIDTPQGHIVMQANDTHGWIASSETLFKQDHHSTDILLPTDE
jgi:hypothetical protein